MTLSLCLSQVQVPKDQAEGPSGPQGGQETSLLPAVITPKHEAAEEDPRRKEVDRHHSVYKVVSPQTEGFRRL